VEAFNEGALKQVSLSVILDELSDPERLEEFFWQDCEKNRMKINAKHRWDCIFSMLLIASIN
jgi:hypothetical protein|tara:strand:- start:479 stop:664 length:186 start_codon:yes stop_codon:yes gene_type:complete